MKHKQLLFSVLVATFLFACGQTDKKRSTEKAIDKNSQETEQPNSKDEPEVKAEDYAKQLEQFIPKGYSILDTSRGDLNLDEFADMILILKKDNEQETSAMADDPEKRPLFILIGQSDGILKKAAKNENSVYCVNCGGVYGDPYEGIVIKNGYFSIEHYGGSNWKWTRTVTYHYSKKDQQWYLHKDGGEQFEVSDPTSSKETVRTTKDFGKVNFVDFDIYTGEVNK